MFTDLLYVDHEGEVAPIPVLRNYSQGLRPVEYFAGAFGARKGIIDLKSVTQDAGFFAKQLVQAAHRLLVTNQDDEDAYDTEHPRGYPVDFHRRRSCLSLRTDSPFGPIECFLTSIEIPGQFVKPGT